MKVLIINGPNLNMLGKREPDVYGRMTLEEMNKFIAGYFKKVQVDFFQSNHEGEIVDRLQQAEEVYDGVVINPGAFTHYAYAIRDAISSISKPVIEVHISNTAGREEFRRKSVVSGVVRGTITGLGPYGYVLAVQALAHQHKRNK